jgi:hypothetical protein
VEEPIGVLYDISRKCQLAQLCRKFVAVWCEDKPVTGPVIIEKAESFYDEMYVTDKCTYSEGRSV